MSDLNHATHRHSGTIRVSPVVPGRATCAPTSSARAIFAAGFTCGVLDITAAFVNWTLRGGGPERLLQAIASGLLGPLAFHGGWLTSALGLAFHFFIAFSAATVFYLASRKLPFLTDRAILWHRLRRCGLHRHVLDRDPTLAHSTHAVFSVANNPRHRRAHRLRRPPHLPQHPPLRPSRLGSRIRV